MTELIRDLDPVDVRGDPGTTRVRAVEFDSRRVERGSLFCCLPGAHYDGHLFAADAVARGATGLLGERVLDLDVTQVCVAPGSVRPAMALVSASFFGHPSRAMTMVGVTGTNGKTTVTRLLASILEGAGRATGVIGTLNGVRTTPESPELQRRLAELRDSGHRAVAMEVSSHGLDQHRVDGIRFDVAVFTNLSRDHLDMHHTMEEYFATKATLFESERAKVAVIGVDDPWGRRLAESASAEVVAVRRSDAADVSLEVGSSSFRWRGTLITLPLTGMFNVENALLAATAASTLGLDPDQIAAGLASAPPVPGRMEVVASGPPFAVLVDYAHTPAGLEAALTSARHLAGAARVICVFGAGGDRDHGKRAEMGEVVSRRADVAVVTSDNPRSEDPGAIISQIVAGMTGPAERLVEPDRSAAIGAAVERAGPGDVVVIAGKGHETSQELADRVVSFDDRVEARRALGGRPRRGGREESRR